MRAVFLLIGAVLAVLPQAALAAAAGEIISISSKGEYRSPSAKDWEAAKVKQSVEGGSFVRTTLADSKMSLLLVDRTQFTLQGVAMAQVKHPEESTAGKSIVDLVKGTARFQTKTPTKGFTVRTPTGLAAIRGTEWLIDADDERSVVTVVEGEVEVSNDFGTVNVLPDEQAILEKGKAPEKRRIQSARDRVQWVSAFAVETARYPELRTLPAGAQGQSLGAIANAVDGGDLTTARALAMAYVARPDLTLATGHFLAADLALYFGNVDEALAILADARMRFPAEKRTDAFIAWAALFADRFALAREAADRGRALAPEVLEVQLAAGEVARLDGDYFAARRAFQAATRIAPSDWRGWHGLARVESARGNFASARVAFEKALALAPGRALVLGERGAMETASGELAKARSSFDDSLVAQPDDYTTWAGLGLARLKAGDADGAIDALLRATLLEPRYAAAHLNLAVAYWQKGLIAQAFATLERASIADPRDPLPYQYAAIMRGDLMQPGLAVEQAREALDRQPFAKSLDAIAGSTRGVANVGAAFAQFGLEQWALRSAQESFDPLWAGSHYFLADRYASRYDRNSELIQGFLTDPLALGGPNRFQSLVTRDGGYATLAWRGGRDNRNHFVEPALTANGLGAEGRVAGFAEFADFRQWQTTDPADQRASTTTFGIGVKPRHDIGIFLYGNQLRPEVRTGSQDPSGNYSILDGSVRRIDGGISWRPSSDYLLWIKAGNGSEDSHLQENATLRPAATSPLLVQAQDFTSQPRRADYQVRALGRFEGGHDVSFGAEGARWNSVDFLERDAFAHLPTAAGLRESVRQDIQDSSHVYMASGRMRIGIATLEAHVDHSRYEKTNDILVRRDYANQLVSLADPHESSRTNGRAGLEVRALPGTTLRLAWQQWLRPAAIGSLTATATAGIALDDRYVLAGGRLDRKRAQFEWEATRALLLSAFTDHQKIDNLYSPLIGVLNNRPDSSNLERLRSRSFNNLAALGELEGFPDLSSGKMRETGVSANLIVNRFLSLYAEGIRASSENTLAYPGKAFAFLPRNRAAVGATFYTAYRIAIGAKAIHRGERFSDEANSAAARLPPEWNGTVQAYWESADKRWSLELLVSNLGAKSADHSVAIAVNARF